jgi:hypothetical protein
MVISLGNHFPMRVTEWLASGFLLSWGVGVLNAPAIAWDQPLNHALVALGPNREFWGWLAIAVALTRLVSLFVNGAVRRSPHARAIGAFVTCLIWSQLTLAFIAVPWVAISAVIYPWLLVADSYNVLRASADARRSDDRARARQDIGRAVPNARGA